MLGAASKLAVALVVVSIVTMLMRWYWLMLQPDDVLHGAVWQLLTFGFVAASPMSVLYGAAILLTVGGTLEVWWGAKKTVRFLIGVTIASGVLTVLVALVIPQLRFAYFAGSAVMSSAAWTAYGWTVGRSGVSMYGVTMTGNQLAAVGILVAVLHAAYYSPIAIIPEGIAIALTYAYVKRTRR